jgi:hypothetical protein
MAKEIIWQQGETPCDDDVLNGTSWLPASGSRLYEGTIYNFPTLEDCSAHLAFYQSQPENFDKPFTGIILNGSLKVPMGTFFRERTSCDGKVNDWDGKPTYIVAPSGKVAEMVRKAVNEAWSLRRLLANLLLQGSGFKVTGVIDVMTTYNKEKKPRQVYKLDFVGDKSDHAAVTAWLNGTTAPTSGTI